MDAERIGFDGEIPDVRSLRIPVQYLANMLTAGAEEPVITALERMFAMRVFMYARNIEGEENQEVLARVGLTAKQVEEMVHLLSVANYEERFVIPTSHPLEDKDNNEERGGCGFTFGNGCSDGVSKPSLFSQRNVGQKKTSESM